jgi:hypothetical protein
MTCAAGCHAASRTPEACRRNNCRDHDRIGAATRQLRTLRTGRGNRRLNHAVHMAAVTQIRYRYRHSDGRAYYDRKLAEGKTPKEGPPLPQTASQRRHLRPPASRRPPCRRIYQGKGHGMRCPEPSGQSIQ